MIDEIERIAKILHSHLESHPDWMPWDEESSGAKETILASAAAISRCVNIVYCPECGSCGESGCCHPDACVQVQCMYGQDSMESYKDLLDENEAMTNALRECVEAIRLTREYVGEEMLPEIEGWSWYDATIMVNNLIGEEE